jgi:hypothetical protein
VGALAPLSSLVEQDSQKLRVTFFLKGDPKPHLFRPYYTRAYFLLLNVLIFDEMVYLKNKNGV